MTNIVHLHEFKNYFNCLTASLYESHRTKNVEGFHSRPFFDALYFPFVFDSSLDSESEMAKACT